MATMQNSKLYEAARKELERLSKQPGKISIDPEGLLMIAIKLSEDPVYTQTDSREECLSVRALLETISGGNIDGLKEALNQHIKNYTHSENDIVELNKLIDIAIKSAIQQKCEQFELIRVLKTFLEWYSFDVPLCFRGGHAGANGLMDMTKEIKDMRRALSEVVFGQDHAIDIFVEGVFRGRMLSRIDKERTAPVATFLFAGSPGVGKTLLAEKAAEELGLPFMRFDMSEYAEQGDQNKLIGHNKTFQSAAPGILTEFVNTNPRCVLLFDEIEKAHGFTINLFLQLLDAGRLRDNFLEKEIPFSGATIIFTTNAGRKLYSEYESGDMSTISRKVILDALMKDDRTRGFPPEICSRFALGNVVMFNKIGAETLRDIAKNEFKRNAENFENSYGLPVECDERVFLSLIFAEGAQADARTIRARAQAFFTSELFDLYRFLESDYDSTDKIEKIRFGFQEPADPEISKFFSFNDKYEILVFAPKEKAELCARLCTSCNFISITEMDQISDAISKNDIRIILIDPTYGLKNTKKYLDLEDMDSKARDFLHYVRENYSEMPLYLLNTDNLSLSVEEKISFKKLGVRGILVPDEKHAGQFDKRLAEICLGMHRINCMNELAKTNRLIAFNSAQMITDGGRTAEISMFEFKLRRAVDSNDTSSILSDADRPNITFDDVIGGEDAKAELRYFAEYMKNPKKYLSSGLNAPKGVLLYGPPGTGKTMLAKAMAGESNVTFIAAEGNQFIKKHYGEGPEAVHEIFRKARKYAPSVLFVDEIDAIGAERDNSSSSRYIGEMLTAFLTEMDGFKHDITKPVFVLAATNFEVDNNAANKLDPALTRRFDRRIRVDLPTNDDRIKFMKSKAEKNKALKISEDKIKNLAVRSTGMSLALLESVFDLAMRTAARNGDFVVTDQILDEAFELSTFGEAKKWDPAELRKTALHETGHALLCWLSGENPSYLTVVARGSHGGYMLHGDTETKGSYTIDELMARIRVSLGGRAAELVYFGERDGLTTGPGSDLKNATSLAQQIICTYGMDKNFGMASIDPANVEGQLKEKLNAAVNEILDRELENAIKTIEANRSAVDALAEELITKNHLSENEITEILEKHCKREK